MTDTRIAFRIPEHQKYRLKELAKHYRTTLSDLVVNVVMEYITRENVKIKLDKNMKRCENMYRKKTLSREQKYRMHELYTIKNAMVRIWDICHADYCLRRNINMGKVDEIRSMAKKMYALCSPKNKKLMKADMQAMMLLNKDSIIQGLESRRLMLKSKAVKQELPYTENREKEIEKTIDL